MKIKVKLLSENAKIPYKKHEDDACYDLYSIENVKIPAGKTVKIRTGIAMEIPKGYYGRIYPRSGLASNEIFVNAGIIDSNYRGEIIVVLHNASKYDYYIFNEERIAQFTLHKQYEIEFEEVEQLDETERNDGGFGSTGK